MSQIDDKYAQLKSHGLDLGAPKAAETDAGSGGRVRQYANGNIYYHPNTGAHEVHGGILSLYLAQGGPGANPAHGSRDLGFPKTDEVEGETPISTFEWGAIYWVRGTGGVVVYGEVYTMYQSHPEMGMPLTSIVSVGGGQAAYFQHGVLYWAASGPNAKVHLVGNLNAPGMGRPQIVDPNAPDSRRLHGVIDYGFTAKAFYDAAVAFRPSVFAELWQGRLAFTPAGQPNVRVMLQDAGTTTGAVPLGQLFAAQTSLEATHAPTDLQDRTLYDLSLVLPNGNAYAIAPHCAYAKSQWESFGVLHVTDIHISGRNEAFRAQLQAKGMPDAAQRYMNYEDNFRDFIKYANHLHDTGKADVVWATGDLVDFVNEDHEPAGWNNFRRLRNLLLGQPMVDGDVAGEELKLPFFSSFGNHDYRVTSYYLTMDLDPIVGSSSAIDEFDDQGLTESEALALQNGDRPSFGIHDLGDALQTLQWDRSGKAYSPYAQWFSSARSYVVPLGIHRMVMLDTKSDDGIPESVGPLGLGFAWDYLTNSLSAETKRVIQTHSPNLVGLEPSEIEMLKGAIRDAGQDGIVIVGIHGPAVYLSGEFPYYLRETVHATTPAGTISEYVSRYKLNAEEWPTGTPYFKVGDNSKGLNNGVFNKGNTDFLLACAGVGLPRPADLILCGHNHKWVEHRFVWNGSVLQHYWDFYTENPPVHYPTRSNFDQPGLPKGSPIEVQIVQGAPVPPAISKVTDHRKDPGAPDNVPPVVYGSAKIPPYAQPLSSATDPKAWWQAHRPLHAMTSALGPIESRQRFGTFYQIDPPQESWRPVIESDTAPHLSGRRVTPVAPPVKDPTFQGFRVIQVGSNVIQRMHYVTLVELRAHNFRMPWELTVVVGPNRGDIFKDVQTPITPELTKTPG